ncbi:MAG: AbrB/MazE/SpoVT family DNA-binding domain-containing protein [Candidatus Thermoplasmatota archaeon]|nr:AbrB/MazE/SpoVT family DNA-binding domain-containing protein [Candidatus Thermoplasmatota archaeon]MCL6089452.1 AbrB/MazE/SpoVT family DNA-binding domain-containing protein [Candidatus Thermoplasmatota archaeon]MDA8144095.1 AbrB/MazE/SpoVT family DNA-binding domain-containing protein [Thermoplasmatales archaeon]
MEKKKLIDVTHISSRGSSFRITLPRRVINRLNLTEDDIIAFYDDDGVKIDKIQ